jgi:hypothetical protein
MSKDDVDKEISAKYCPRFAQIAVEKGYVSPDNAKAALSRQLDDDLAGKTHKLIGSIFLENGWITPQQIETVLNDLFKN